jgi:hypothetical protein
MGTCLESSVCTKKAGILAAAFVVLAIVPLSAQQGAGISVGYMGELFSHPGLLVGAQWSVLESAYGNLLVQGQAGFYVHPRNNLGILFWPGIVWRYTWESGFSVAFQTGAGYLITRPLGDGGTQVYRFSDDESSVIEGEERLYHHVSPFAGIVLGIDLEIAPSTPINVHTSFNLFGQYPFNDYMLPRVSSEWGITFYPDLQGKNDD